MNWDQYFLHLAKEVSLNSKCFSRKIGAVLVRDKSIISTGYNGPARGVKHCDERNFDFFKKLEMSVKGEICVNFAEEKKVCPRRLFMYPSGKGLHLCQSGHAERNALIQAARFGIATDGTTMYCYCPLPCKDCMIEIINAGVKMIVHTVGADYDGYSRILANEARIGLKAVELEEKFE